MRNRARLSSLYGIEGRNKYRGDCWGGVGELVMEMLRIGCLILDALTFVHAALFLISSPCELAMCDVPRSWGPVINQYRG